MERLYLTALWYNLVSLYSLMCLALIPLRTIRLKITELRAMSKCWWRVALSLFLLQIKYEENAWKYRQRGAEFGLFVQAGSGKTTANRWDLTLSLLVGNCSPQRLGGKNQPSHQRPWSHQYNMNRRMPGESGPFQHKSFFKPYFFSSWDILRYPEPWTSVPIYIGFYIFL